MEKLAEIKGIGPKTIEMLKKLNIYTMEDLIHFFPYKYNIIKRSEIENLKHDDNAIIDGIVENIPRLFYFNAKQNKMSFRMITSKHLMNVVIFNRGFLKNKLTAGTKVIVIGKYDIKSNTIIASELRFGEISDIPKIEPVYHSTYGLTGTQVKTYIDLVLNKVSVINYIPKIYMERYSFTDKIKAINEIHNPVDLENLDKYREQLKYEELFLFMLQMNYLKLNKNKENGISRNVDYSLVEEFINSLPFSLTKDQETAALDIYHDLNSSNKMNRLLQGDVGSGKTIVAIIAMYINHLSGYMSALMAPTEVLARQHYQNILNIFEGTNINVRLLTGKMKKSERREIENAINEGTVNIVIGTHALITDDLNYKKLGLVITDEQHRFGVNQRGAFKNKGIDPDILYMSATPIPRTYALTLYGDMDISNIKTMPAGRKEIKTFIKSEKELKDVLELMLIELKKGHQIYVVVPLIEESDKSDMDSVLEIYEKMNKAFGKLFNVDKLHGKMKSEEKDEVITKFKNNQTQILVSTTVIEVGIDVFNATMMVIYDSYRFGLSTLHQLRGRVGRSNLESTCILISNRETERLSILTKTNDGFLISEEDFRLRGSGDLFGVKQSGDMSFRIANIKSDYNILLRAKDDSEEFILNNPNIFNIENPYLKDIIESVNNLN